MNDAPNHVAPSSENIRQTIRHCIDAWFLNHIGIVPGYGDETSLLSLGMDSLAAAGLAMDLSDALGFLVSDDELFERPSVAELSELLVLRMETRLPPRVLS